MTTTDSNIDRESNIFMPEGESAENSSAKRVEVLRNHDFIRLREAYQNADFIMCQEILARLEKTDPNNPLISKYRDEIDIRISVKTIVTSNRREKQRKKKTGTLRLGFFAIFGTVIVIIAFVFSYFYFSEQVSARQLEQESIQLAALKAQAEQLLLLGQPRPAVEVLDRIRIINPAYPPLSDLEALTLELLVLENKYQTAVDLQAQNNSEEALNLYQEIESQRPGLWDISHQIKILEENLPTQEALSE